jgi:YidC/Oxa1 family membrane protein insertase
MNFQTANQTLPSRASVSIPFKVFFGPKSRDLLEGAYYYDFPRRYNQTLVMTGGMCGLSFCESAQLVDWLVDLLRGFHWICWDWGLSIILLVILVRAILHPITKHSQVSMMKMQKMGPELERLKKKFGDDKEGYAKAQMEVYKGVGVTPILGCLPMFLQMPIWIALYAVLQSDIALRQAPFLWGFTWIHDLAQPDKLIPFAHSVSIFGFELSSFNLLPVLLAVAYFMQQKYTPKPPAATPEQAKQQKMMQWMSLLFPIFLYNYPSGLNLYIFTSSAFGIIESRSIRAHIKRKQEAEKSEQVIVDAKPTRAGKENRKEEKKEKSQGKQPEKSGVVGGWWARMQQKVEELREQAERANNKKKK